MTVNREQNLSALRRRLIIKRIKTVAISLLLFTLFSFLAWYVREGDFFRFRGINIFGFKKISEKEIRDYFTERKNSLFLAKVLKDDNSILWFTVDVDDLPRLYPRIENISLSRNFLDRTIRISFTEKKEKYIWCAEIHEEKECYWLDESGEVFAKAPDAEGELIRVIHDKSARPITMGDRPFTSSEIANFKKIIFLAEKWSWKISATYLKSAEINDVFVVLKTGQEIYFNLDVDPRYGDPIVSALNESNEWSSVEYLDLRIPGKGFYKIR